MVNMCGYQLRHLLKVKFINEQGIDAGGLIAEFVTLMAQTFGGISFMFENFGIERVCISTEAAAMTDWTKRFLMAFIAQPSGLEETSR